MKKLRTTHKIDPTAEPPKFNSVMSSFGDRARLSNKSILLSLVVFMMAEPC